MNRIFFLIIFLYFIIPLTAQNKIDLFADTTYVVKTIKLNTLTVRNPQLFKIFDTVITVETNRDFEREEHYVDPSRLKNFQFSVCLQRKFNNDSLFIIIEYANKNTILYLSPYGYLKYNNYLFFINGNKKDIDKLFVSSTSLKTFSFKDYKNIMISQLDSELPQWIYAYFQKRFYLIWNLEIFERKYKNNK